MNLLLLEPEELLPGSEVRLANHRARHLRQVLGVAPGATVRAGVVGGARGKAHVLALEGDAVRLRLELDEPPTPEPSPRLELLLALPRPKVLRRLVYSLAALGVSRLDLCAAWRVEKSYFQSPFLEPAALRAQLVRGAELACVTRLPEVAVHPLLVPYLHALATVAERERRVLAHPGAPTELAALTPLAGARCVRAAIGPEGGWIAAELASLEAAGFTPVSLGPRVLSSELALPYLVGQLQLLAGAREKP